VREFNRLIDLMNSARAVPVPLIAFIAKEVEKLQLRVAWLHCLRLWQGSLQEIEFAAAIVAREPISESEHRRRVEAAAARFVDLETLVNTLVKERRAWARTTWRRLPGRKSRSSKRSPGSG